MTAKQVEFFDSTIAITAYNWLAVYRTQPATLAEIFAGVRAFYADPRIVVREQQVEDGVARLVAMNLLVRREGVKGPDFDIVDPKRRPVTRRRVTVVAEDHDSGWEDWVFFNREVATRSLTQFEPIPR